MKATVIKPGKISSEYFKDLFRYRELFYFLSWRDILVRYKQTVIGVAWSVIRPVLTMVVFTIVFGKLAKLPSDNIPYPILVFTALLPWQFFANAISLSGTSLVTNANLVSKVYFPRIIIPSVSIVVSFVDFIIAVVILVVLMVWYKYVPTINVLFVPLFTLMAAMFALGIGLWVSALNVKYRDFQHIIPFIAQFGLYISPVGFSSSIVPFKWKFLYSLNPMVGVIDGFRWAVLGNTKLYTEGLVSSGIIILLIFFSGLSFFRKTENTFADII